MTSCPVGGAFRAAFLATLLLCIVPFAFGIDDEGPPPASDQQVRQCRALMDYSEMFRFCEMFDLARLMADAARSQVASLASGDPLRLEIEARYIVYTYRVGAPGWRTGMAAALLPRMRKRREPYLRHWMFRVEAWEAREKRDWRRFEDMSQQALNQAVLTDNPLRLKADTTFMHAGGLYEAGRLDEAVTMVEGAQSFYSVAGETLPLTDAYRLLALCYKAQGKATARELSESRVTSTVTSLDQGPILDLQQVAGRAQELKDAHVRLADEGKYLQAIHATVTLMVLKKARKEGRIGEIIPLSEASLEVWTSLYMRERGDDLAGDTLFANAQSDADREFVVSPIDRTRFRVLSARYLRVSGRTREAVEELANADRILARLGHVDAFLSMDIQEQRGLALLGMGQPAAATHAFENALKLAQTAGVEDKAQRFQRFLDEVAKGNTDPDALTRPARESAKDLAHTARLAMRTAGPEVFHSPFMADYSAGQKKSGADVALAVPLHRARPTPKGVEMTVDDLVAARKFPRAIDMQKDEIDSKGETVPRLLKLGRIYMKASRFDEAKGVFQHILELDAGNALARQYVKDIDDLQRMKQMP